MKGRGMKTISMIALATALAVSTPVWADDPPAKIRPGSSKAADKPAADKTASGEKLICAREEQTDSFIPKRVCRTQEQIDELRRGAERLRDDQQLLNGRPQDPPGR
jgi:hypothetical protein